MYTVCYYKVANHWYLEATEYLESGGNPDELERIGAFHDFLDLAAEGASSVVFQMDTHPFEGAESCELSGSSGGDTGGYYRIKSFRGLPLDLELWFNTLIYLNNPVLPPNIYFKRVSPL